MHPTPASDEQLQRFASRRLFGETGARVLLWACKSCAVPLKALPRLLSCWPMQSARSGSRLLGSHLSLCAGHDFGTQLQSVFND
jgi:hypothetical protein